MVTLTHVCQYWRRAIISSPGSWTSIDSNRKKLAPLFLECSGAASLSADISVEGVDFEEDEDFMRALLPHVPRISNLSLYGFQPIEDLETHLPSFFASPMPNLTSLKLEQEEESTDPFPPEGVPTPQLFQNVSKLKSLHLTGVPLYPVLRNIKSLAELTLVSDTFPFQEFLGFLESNPNLEILDLDVLFANTPALATPERLISFPRLRRLTLRCGDATSTRALLSCLSLSHGINIEVYQTNPNPPPLASFLPCPSTHILGLFAPIIIIKYLSPPGTLHLSSKNGSFSFRGCKPSRVAHEELDLFATCAVREFRLRLGNQCRLSWTLGRLPKLEALVISNGSLEPEFLSVLAEDPVLCPSLKTIAFLECELTNEAVHGLGGILAKRAHSIAARLHRVVIVNRTRDLPNRHLVSHLQRFIPQVDIAVGNKLPDLL